MELRARRNQTEEVAAKEEGSESTKRRRSYTREVTVDGKHRDSQRMRGVIDGGFSDSSGSSEYEPKDDEDDGSEGEISLEAESNVEGDNVDAVGSGGDLVADIPDGSWRGVQSKKWLSREGRDGVGGMGSTRVHVQQWWPCNEGGIGRSSRHGRKRCRQCLKGGEDSEVVVRSRCTLKKLVAMNGRMTSRQRAAVEGSVLRPCLEYCDIGMERNLTVALIKCWVPRWKAFRVGGRRIPFSVFDVALMTGLPATGRKVELEGEQVSSEVGSLIQGRMSEWEQQEMMRRVPGRSGKKRRFFKNYVSAMAESCEEIVDEDRVGLWLQMYAFLILSGVFFSYV